MKAVTSPSRRSRPGRLALSGAIVLLLGLAPAWAGSLAAHSQAPLLQQDQAGPSITNEWCPVLPDERTDPEIHTEFRGAELYFCCQKCVKQFRVDPAAYVGNVPARDPGDDEEDHGEQQHAVDVEDDHVPGSLVTGADAEQHDHADHGDRGATALLALIQRIGRFHPMIVHFPIALLLMAGVAEFLSIMSGGNRMAFAARFCLWGGTISAAIAAPLGWANALAVEDDYVGFSATLLLYHRWIRVTTALVAGFALYSCERSRGANGKSWKLPYRITLFLGMLLVTAAGHLGASLIYGWEYLF